MSDCFITYDKLIDSLPINRGDILDISSDLQKIFLRCRKNKEDFDPGYLLDSIKEKVGPEGTLMIRTWNWDFCRGATFDIRKSPSRAGALGNVALNRDDFKRTEHPLYSYCVWGHHVDALMELNDPSAFGEKSTFAFLHFLVLPRQFSVGQTYFC